MKYCEAHRADVRSVLPHIPGLERLSGKRVLITGGTGLICSGVVDIRCAPAIPPSMAELVELLKNGIVTGAVEPFRRRVVAQDGRVITDGGRGLSTEEILHIDWLCDRVRGEIPPFEALLPIARSIVRLQGIYRDSIPPDKDGILI